MAGSAKPASAKAGSKADSDLLLLVEGINDCHAILHLTWLTFKTEPVFGVHECGSDDKVLDKLAATLVSSHAKQKDLGLVLDADISGASTGQVIQSRLSQLVSRAGSYYSFPAAFKDIHLAKAVIHTYLSWQDPPDMHQLGLAKRTGKFEDIGAESQAFMQWIQKLFGQSG